MIGELRGAEIFAGIRGRPPADTDALAEAIVTLSQFAVTHADAVESIDINPFLLRPKGQGAVALDALIIRRSDG